MGFTDKSGFKFPKPNKPKSKEVLDLENKVMGRKSKYGNLTCQCNHGHIHRSRFEGKVCDELHYEYDKQLKAGTAEITTEKRFDFIIEGVKICSHYMDFLITFDDGKQLAVEAKGAVTAVWRIKKKLFQVLYPYIDYEIRYYK